MSGIILFVIFVVCACRMEKRNEENFRRYFDE